jgi:hypothetical protein
VTGEWLTFRLHVEPTLKQFSSGDLPSGVVVALLGTETRSGDFEVADAIFAGLPDYVVKADATVKKEEGMELDDVPVGDGWVALISGLEVETSSATVTVEKASEKENGVEDGGMMGYSEKELRLMLLTDWLSGHVGEADVSVRMKREEADAMHLRHIQPHHRNGERSRRSLVWS